MTYFLVKGDLHRPNLIFLKLDEELSNELKMIFVALAHKAIVTDRRTTDRQPM